MKTTRKKTPAGPLPAEVPERVRLAREHTHQGEKKPAGAEISVHPVTARWLRATGVVSQPSTKE